MSFPPPRSRRYYSTPSLNTFYTSHDIHTLTYTYTYLYASSLRTKFYGSAEPGTKCTEVVARCDERKGYGGRGAAREGALCAAIASGAAAAAAAFVQFAAAAQPLVRACTGATGRGGRRRGGEQRERAKDDGESLFDELLAKKREGDSNLNLTKRRKKNERKN